MKLNKKSVLVISLIVCLIATISVGTLAWFTDTDSAKNEFFVTNSENTDPEKIFSIDVKENVEGTDSPVDGYTFNNLVPNQTVQKKPYVINTGAYDQYVRATVTISDYNVFAATLGEDYIMENVFGGINSEWTFEKKIVDTTADNGSGTVSYVFYLNRVLSANASDPAKNTAVLFETVTIPKELEKEDFAAPSTLANGFYIEVFAEAIQSDNTGSNAKEAFALIDAP